ncbi:Rix1 complex component [Coemansia spiralis]|nr:Rix1 complex component [Coemansia spiralis]
MPKTSKKKQRKAEDFKKVKLKIGKKKAPPTNATDTSFTSKSIVLADQSITADKSSQLTNSRNLTLKDILSQLRHYSVVTRKEAVVGMADLLSLHSELLATELGPIVEGTIRLVVDDEPVVRKNLLQLYNKFLPNIPARDLAPFVPLLVIFICSAMTHILDDIRADAVKFLDLLVELIPAYVAQFSSKILPNFYSLLETNTPSSENKHTQINSRTTLLTQGSRLVIMRSCHNYLAAYTKYLKENSDPFWFMSRGNMSVSGKFALVDGNNECKYPLRNCTDGSLYFHPHAPLPYGALNLFGESSTANANNNNSNSNSNSNKPDNKGSALIESNKGINKEDAGILSIATTNSRAVIRVTSKEALSRLFPFLQATWVESAAMFGTGQIATDKPLEMCTFVIQILQTLWRAAYSDGIPPSDKSLIGFLRQCMVYFPFGESYIGQNDVEEALLSLNIKTCELVALVQLGLAKDAKVDPAIYSEMTKWTKRTVKFLLQTLGLKAKKQTTASKLQMQQVAVSIHFKYDNFVELLPVVWQMMRGTSQKDAEWLLMAVIHYADVCQSSSASKALCIRFLAKIIEAQWSRAPVDLGTLDLSGAQLKETISSWALELPKLMWQLRNRNLDASTAAAETLRLIHQRTRLLDAKAAATVQASLVTLFCVEVPGKGTVYGPFNQYPADLQRTVLEVISYSPQLSQKLSQAVRSCIAECTPSDQVKVLVEEIMGF